MHQPDSIHMASLDDIQMHELIVQQSLVMCAFQKKCVDAVSSNARQVDVDPHVVVAPVRIHWHGAPGGVGAGEVEQAVEVSEGGVLKKHEVIS